MGRDWGALLHQAYSFELEVDTSSFGSYIKGGLVTQVKEPKTLAFKKLADALADPGDFLFSDFAKLERSPLLHLGFQALDAFQVRSCGVTHVSRAAPEAGDGACSLGLSAATAVGG
jgi:Ubiquitin-activating enzyme E1 four-helix bundle